MEQFDVCRNANGATKRRVPYLLVLQHKLLTDLATIVVAPLLPEGTFHPAARLHPVFEIDGKRMLLSTAELASVPKKILGAPITNLKDHRDEIIAAIDLVFTGV